MPGIVAWISPKAAVMPMSRVMRPTLRRINGASAVVYAREATSRRSLSSHESCAARHATRQRLLIRMGHLRSAIQAAYPHGVRTAQATRAWTRWLQWGMTTSSRSR